MNRRIYKIGLLLLFVFGAYSTLNAAPEIGIVAKKGKIISQAEGSNYNWFFNGKKLQGVTSSEMIPMREGVYTVKYTDAKGAVQTQKVQYSAKKATALPQIIIIGDSTASIYGSNKYPRTGWGQVLQPFLNSEAVEVLDMAISGRSSKSFYSDANGWVKVLEELDAGDYLFIQFGHNDQKDDERYTDPYTTYQEYLSIYIDTAIARGAYPVLLTSIHRNGWSGDQINDSHGDYPPAMRALAAEKNVPLIDLTAKTEVLFESLGEDYTTNTIFNNLEAGIWEYYPTGNEDNTHLQENGAYEVCKLVVEDFTLQDSIAELSALKDMVKETGRVTAMPSPNLSGSISGNGIYSIGDEVTLTASGKSSFLFSGWYESDVLYSSESTITFTLDSESRDFVVAFDEAYKVTLKQDPAFKGIVTGAGDYLEGDTVVITASPKAGYQFVSWKLGDAVVTTDTAYSFEMTAEDVTYTAVFEAAPVSDINSIQNESVKIFPNPAKDFISISSDAEIKNIELIDLNGKTVFSENVNSTTHTINLSSMGYHSFSIVKVLTSEGVSFHNCVVY